MASELVPGRPVTWSDARQITFDEAYTGYSDLSPDGTRVVFSSDRGGNHDLWVVPVDAGEPTQLTTEWAPDWAPEWSPSGEDIVFYSYRTGHRDLWIQRAHGGPARQVTRFEGTHACPRGRPTEPRSHSCRPAAETAIAGSSIPVAESRGS